VWFLIRAAAALQDCGQKFAYVNVLSDPEIFENLPRFADWPTFPQVYVDGELIGGCDITLEMHASGDLRKRLMRLRLNGQPKIDSLGCKEPGLARFFYAPVSVFSSQGVGAPSSVHWFMMRQKSSAVFSVS